VPFPRTTVDLRLRLRARTVAQALDAERLGADVDVRGGMRVIGARGVGLEAGEAPPLALEVELACVLLDLVAEGLELPQPVSTVSDLLP
jgi:hypothetical protein